MNYTKTQVKKVNQYDIKLAGKAQAKFCKKNKYPHFAPINGICWSCGNQIYDKVSIVKAGKELITGCPICCRTFCD